MNFPLVGDRRASRRLVLYSYATKRYGHAAEDCQHESRATDYANHHLAITAKPIIAKLGLGDKSYQFVGTTLFVSRHWVAVVTMTAKSI